MIIKLSPVRSDEALPVVSCAGDVLTVNGEAFDFGPLAAGAILPASAIRSTWFVGTVQRVDGEISLTLRLPHGRGPSAAVAFPADIRVAQGKVTLPFDVPTSPAYPGVLKA